MDPKTLLKGEIPESEYAKLEELDHPVVWQFVADAVRRCRPESVFVCTDAPGDLERVRRMALEQREEEPLALEGHTVHFDGPRDQARDKANTRYLVTPDMDLGARLNSIDRDEGLAEVLGYLDGAMAGKTMIVRLLTLGPTDSEFCLPCVQITDSAYVAHSETLLYRPGFEELKRRGPEAALFRFLHSAGALEGTVSRDVDKRRIYIDLVDDVVYSVNTQYAGNTVGLKKLAFRLAIRKADQEGWLAEHMFLMAVVGPGGRKSYFAGAFPSACGKTSTAMTPGNRIVGDDLAYLRRRADVVRAVNVESGIFGIIQGVCEKDDPVIWKVLHEPGEVIFSNVLVADGRPYWLDMGIEIPDRGRNFVGQWHRGMTDEEGRPIPPAHKNARYTVRLEDLENVDEALHDPDGVVLSGIIYGGRDPDTWVPVCEAFDWAHGVVTMGASLESKTTAATLGQEGVLAFNPMSILDFLSIPIGRYLSNHLRFVDGLQHPPRIFGVNYFLEDGQGHFLNDKLDKVVWLQWMERRVRGEAAGWRTPVGIVPRYEDLADLFHRVLGKEYRPDDYRAQFAIRVDAHLDKLARIRKIYEMDVPDAPRELFEQLDAQAARLRRARQEYGSAVIPPEAFEPTSP